MCVRGVVCARVFIYSSIAIFLSSGHRRLLEVGFSSPRCEDCDSETADWQITLRANDSWDNQVELCLACWLYRELGTWIHRPRSSAVTTTVSRALSIALSYISSLFDRPRRQ